jgi:hypothetical protein
MSVVMYLMGSEMMMHLVGFLRQRAEQRELDRLFLTSASSLQPMAYITQVQCPRGICLRESHVWVGSQVQQRRPRGGLYQRPFQYTYVNVIRHPTHPTAHPLEQLRARRSSDFVLEDRKNVTDSPTDKDIQASE